MDMPDDIGAILDRIRRVIYCRDDVPCAPCEAAAKAKMATRRRRKRFRVTMGADGRMRIIYAGGSRKRRQVAD